VAGTLPQASRPTIPQRTVLLRPWTRVPTLLVAAAKNRSVPTAVARWMPNSTELAGQLQGQRKQPCRPGGHRVHGAELWARGRVARPGYGLPAAVLPVSRVLSSFF